MKIQCKLNYFMTQRAFDLAAYEGYMIARVKKSVNHSRIIQSMREKSFSFLFRRHIGFLGPREG